jgi:uncharacterized surface protein with fasciclin (FAS1) repeats
MIRNLILYMNKIQLLAPVLALSAFIVNVPVASAMMSGDGAMHTDSMKGTMKESMDKNMMDGENLMVGSRGEGVVSLQTWLESNGFLILPSGVAKGYFGARTKIALAHYQKEEGITARGFYGPLTRAARMHKMAMMTSTNTAAVTVTPTPPVETGVLVGGALMTPNRDIVANALNANNVTTLVAAVKAAGLVATLQGAGPFTVFAPTNNAFAKLPAGTVDTLLKPENLSKLTDILTYHVVAGRYTAADLKEGMTLTTVEGKKITIGKSATGQITVNGSAKVETADVISSNGVTFVIDSVLTPQ